jgi:hypothetical protein
MLKKNGIMRSVFLPTLIFLAPFLIAAEGGKHFDLPYFGLNAPARAGWNLSSERTESIWFMRTDSPREFSRIGVLKVEDLPRDLWNVSDRDLARTIIDEYRQAAVRGGHGFTDKRFGTVDIAGKTFYGSTARVTKIHNSKIEDSFVYNSLYYVYIPARIPGEAPDVFVFLMSNFKKRSNSADADMEDFISVLSSFYTKEELPPV